MKGEHFNNNWAWQKATISVHDNNSFIKQVLYDWLKDTLTAYSKVMERQSLLVSSPLIMVKTHPREKKPQPLRWPKTAPGKKAEKLRYNLIFSLWDFLLYIQNLLIIIIKMIELTQALDYTKGIKRRNIMLQFLNNSERASQTLTLFETWHDWKACSFSDCPHLLPILQSVSSYELMWLICCWKQKLLKLRQCFSSFQIVLNR